MPRFFFSIILFFKQPQTPRKFTIEGILQKEKSALKGRYLSGCQAKRSIMFRSKPVQV